MTPETLAKQRAADLKRAALELNRYALHAQQAATRTARAMSARGDTMEALPPVAVGPGPGCYTDGNGHDVRYEPTEINGVRVRVDPEDDKRIALWVEPSVKSSMTWGAWLIMAVVLFAAVFAGWMLRGAAMNLVR